MADKGKRRNRTLKVSRQGWEFLLATLAVTIPAYLLNHSLLFLFAGLFAAIFIYNALVALANAARLTVSVASIPILFAGETARLTVNVTNGKRLFGSLYLRLKLEGTGLKAEAVDVEGIPRRGKCELMTAILPDRRGPAHLAGLELSTSYPFGLWRRTCFVPLARDLVVFPHIYRDRESGGEALSLAAGVVPKNTDDYQYLAPYQPGDDVRMIHWKKSALLDTPVIRRDLAQNALMEPSLFIPDATPQFEHVVSLLATRISRNPEQANWVFYTEQGIQTPNTVEGMLTVLAFIQPLDSVPDMAAFLGHGYKPVRASHLALKG